MKEESALRFRKQFADTSTTYSAESDAPAHRRPKKKKKKKPAVPADLEVFAGGQSVKPPTEILFCSRSEEICAALLRMYIPTFTLQPGVTFQVPIAHDDKGNTMAVDFLVDGVLFEYHPVRFHKNKRRFGDFRDGDEYREYTKIIHSLADSKRAFFQQVMRDRLAVNYFEKRRALLDSNPQFRKTELIVATSPEEFYFRVITRFGRNYPKSIDKFLRHFDQLRCEL